MRRKWIRSGVSVGILLGLCFIGLGEEAASNTEGPIVPVHVVRLEKRTLHRYVVGYGHVIPRRPTPKRSPGSILLTAAQSGVIQAVLHAEGEAVAKGEPIVRFDTRAADAAVAQAQAALQTAEAEWKRVRRLAQDQNVSQKQLEEARARLAAARAALQQAKVRRSYLEPTTPIDGILVRLFVKPGDTVNAGAPLARIVQPDATTVEVQVPSFAISSVQVGQTAKLLTPTQNGSGKVVFVDPTIRPETGCGTVRILPNQALALRPGEFVKAEIAVEIHRDVLTAPLSSVVRRSGQPARIALVKGNEAELVPVTLGIEEGNFIEVSGPNLREGTPIVGKEAYGLPPRTRIHILNQP